METSTKNSSYKNSRTIDRLIEFKSKSQTVTFNIDHNQITYTLDCPESPLIKIRVSGDFQSYIRKYITIKLKVDPILTDVILQNAYTGYYGLAVESNNLEINYSLEANRDFVRRN